VSWSGADRSVQQRIVTHVGAALYCLRMLCWKLSLFDTDQTYIRSCWAGERQKSQSID